MPVSTGSRQGGRQAERGGTQTGTRTQDQLVKSQLLYQLSYLRIVGFGVPSGSALGRGGLGS